ncbi:MAG: polysaccharide deacetylase family protein [Hyphomicrobium sp.]
MLVTSSQIPFAAALLMIAGMSPTATAADQSLQAACFAPDTLRALDDEKLIARGDRRFDKPPKADAALAPSAAIDIARRGAIRRVDLPKGEKLVALTFDLCEQRGEIAGYDGALFDTLRRENVKATLFAGGKWMRSHEARTEQLMTDPLFEIANHGENHRNLRLFDLPTIQSEIAGPQLAYERARRRLVTTQCAARVPGGVDALPPRMNLFRFPFGACNEASLAAVNDAGLLAIQWDVASGDPDPRQSPQAIANAIVRGVKPGSIVVLHGNGRGWNTAAAMPLVIPKLKALGYAFVTVSELLARGTPVIETSCYSTKPGDTDRYDFLAGAKLNPTPATPSSAGAVARESGPGTRSKPQVAPRDTADHTGPALNRPF